MLDFWELFGPHARQLEFLRLARLHRYGLYGGARGGGKSRLLRWGLVWMLLEFAAAGHRGVRVGLFSEDYPTLKDRQITKIRKEFPPELGELRDTQAEGLGFYLREEYGGGAVLLRNLDDPSKYQSAEFAGVAVEELTKNPIDTFDVLRGSLRWPGIGHTFFWGATNPGGPGHLWVKALWIDRDYSGDYARFKPLEGDFYFVRSLPADNPFLPQTYWDELNSLAEPLRRAWVEGNWDVFEGQALSEWTREAHVADYEPPRHAGWRWSGGGDWGYREPGVLYLIATGPERSLVRLEYVFRETEPYRVGYHWGKLILPFPRPEWFAVDTPAVSDGGPTILEELQRGLNDAVGAPRVHPPVFINPPKGAGSRVTKLQLLHKALAYRRAEDGKIYPWGMPRLQFHPSCKYAIRTLPALPVHPNNSEDVDTDAEDHAYDAITSWLMARTPHVERQRVKRQSVDEHPGFRDDGRRADAGRRAAPWDEDLEPGPRWQRVPEEVG